jgi:hypothetical protein
MAGPYLCSKFSNPKIGWHILFDFSNREFSEIDVAEVYRVCEIKLVNGREVFYVEFVDRGPEIEMVLDEAMEHDELHYGKSGSHWRTTFGNPAIGQYIYNGNKLFRVSFAGDYTIDLERVHENN